MHSIIILPIYIIDMIVLSIVMTMNLTQSIWLFYNVDLLKYYDEI